MHIRQAGVSLLGLIVILALLAVVAVFGMKLIPSYMEYRAARNAIFAIARERPNATPADVRKAFEARSNIDGIESIKPEQLEVGKGSISFAYRKEVPMFNNVGVYIDFAADTAKQ
jgi:hypothetical protein